MAKTGYTEEIGEAICARLAAGETLRQICRDDDMPPESNVRYWVLKDEGGFAAQYSLAREIQAHLLFDQCLEIADDGRNDSYVDADGNRHTDWDVIQRSKLRIDTRKFYLAKVLPKIYGDRLNLGQGDDRGAYGIGELTDEQLKKRTAAVKNRLAKNGAGSKNGKRNGAKIKK